MTRKKVSLDPERKFIINLIVSDRFCKEIIPLVRPQYFQTSYAREICKWCAEYYSQFEKAPSVDIKSIYHSKRGTINDEETKDEVSFFLASISKQYEELTPNNIEFEITEAVKFLKIRAIEILNNNLSDAIIENNPDKGEQALSNFKRVEKQLGQGIDLLKDTQAVVNAFIKDDNIVIQFPGALGRVIQPIARGDFVSFFGPAKRGKSHWLWYSAELAMSQQCKVLLFTLEMTEHAIVRRAWPALTGKPIETRSIQSAKFVANDEGKFEVVQRERVKEGIGVESETIEYFQKKLKRIYRKGAIKIIFPTEALNIEGIECTLDNLYYYENWKPDVIVIDYADYMVPSKGFKSSDTRSTIGNIWQGLRQLSIHRNIAIVTASHTAKITFDTDIKTSHASEDIRKINNVTMAIGLNQTNKEKELNIMRVGLMEIREGRKISEQAVVTQCLDLGRPCLDSRMRSEVVLTPEKEDDGYDRKKRE